MNKFIILLSFLLFSCDKLPFEIKFKKKQEEIKSAINLKENYNGIKFTFDDGPDAAKTPQILNILKEKQTKAIFFVEGINLVGDSILAQKRKEILKNIIDSGHEIGNHTYDHKDVCKLSIQKMTWEIEYTNKLIQDITGIKPKYFRAPYGKKCKQLFSYLKSINMTPIYWDIDPREWQRDNLNRIKTSEYIVDDVLRQVNKLKEQGLTEYTIILHDTKNITLDVLKLLFLKLK